MPSLFHWKLFLLSTQNFNKINKIKKKTQILQIRGKLSTYLKKGFDIGVDGGVESDESIIAGDIGIVLLVEIVFVVFFADWINSCEKIDYAHSVVLDWNLILTRVNKNCDEFGVGSVVFLVVAELDKGFKREISGTRHSCSNTNMNRFFFFFFNNMMIIKSILYSSQRFYL